MITLYTQYVEYVPWYGDEQINEEFEQFQPAVQQWSSAESAQLLFQLLMSPEHPEPTPPLHTF